MKKNANIFEVPKYEQSAVRGVILWICKSDI